MSNDKQFIDFKKEVEKLKEIDGAEEYAKQLAHLFLGNGLSLQTILLMAIDFGQQHPNWISVKDKLPPHDTEYEGRMSVDCYITDGVDVEISYYNYYNNTWDDVRLSGKVTHWYIPQPPRKED